MGRHQNLSVAALRSLVAFAACSAVLGCTLIVDDKLAEPAADDAASPSSTNDAAPGADDDGGHDSGAPTADASADAERARDAGSSTGEFDASGPASADDAGGSGSTDGAVDAAQPTATEAQACAGEDHACALTKAGKMVCWGANEEDQGRFPLDRSYRRVACGDYHSCALDSAGNLLCVGRNRNGQRVSQPGPYEEVTAGDAHTCVLDAAGSARCFGLDTGGQSKAPTVPLRSLTAGTGFTCAIRRADSKVQCWGFGAADLTSAVSDTAFASIDAARNYVCGVTDTGAVRCWSSNAPPAPDRALKVSAGAFGACALLVDRSVRCWSGANVTTPYADKGPFQDVIVGGTGRCLLPAQGATLCEPGAPTSTLSPGPASLD